MGLFVAQDGHYQSWLAVILCCFAAVSEDEHPVELRKSRPTTRAGTCLEQPVPLTALPKLATSGSFTHSKGDEPVSPLGNNDSTTITFPTDPPSLKPLDLGGSSLISRTTHKRPQSSFRHASAPSISTPASFRRLEYTDGQRASLVPLKLGPVVLRESPCESPAPLPESEPASNYARKRSDSMAPLLPQTNRESYRAQRDTPFQRCQQSSLTALPARPLSSPLLSSRTAIPPVIAPSEQRGRHQLSRQSSSSSLHRQALETQASNLFRRSSSDRDRNRLKRKRSSQSVRKHSTDRGEVDVEKEVLELNTIVEERRAEQLRPQSPEAQHIAAIAPTMQLRARSETLNDIGSALARPLTAREPHRINTSLDSSQKPSRPSTSRASSRVSGWLSGLLPTATPPPAETQEPFYKCVPPTATRQRAYSETSLCASTATVTELESPLSLTAASSPISRGHARSLTAESRMTPISPPSTIYDHDQDVVDARKEAEEHWPVEIAHSQVGLAL